MIFQSSVGQKQIKQSSDLNRSGQRTHNGVKMDFVHHRKGTADRAISNLTHRACASDRDETYLRDDDGGGRRVTPPAAVISNRITTTTLQAMPLDQSSFPDEEDKDKGALTISLRASSSNTRARDKRTGISRPLTSDGKKR